MARLRRSILFVPGSSEKMLQKARQLTIVDCVVLDLEDGVAAGEKERARARVTEALATSWGRIEVGVRINGLDTGLAVDDLRAVIPAGPDFIFVPKVERRREVFFIEGAARALARSRVPDLILTFETAKGVLGAERLANASPLVSALAFGAADFAKDTGAQAPADLDGMDGARLQVAMAAATARIAALDGAFYQGIDDLGAMEAQARRAALMGYAGKLVIHPSHIAIANKVFSPSPEVIADALAMVAAFEAASGAGQGAFRYKGRMVDIPMIDQARKLIALADSL